MAKTVIAITIDSEIAMHYRFVEKINLSKTINDFLKSMMDCKIENEDEQKLLLEIEETKQQKEEIIQKQMTLSSKLSRLKAAQEEDNKKEMERAEFVDDTMRNSGAVQDLMRSL